MRRENKTANMYLKVISSHTSSEEYKYIYFFNNTRNKLVLVKKEIHVSLATTHQNLPVILNHVARNNHSAK